MAFAMRNETSDGAPPLILHVIHHFAMGGMENGLVNLINRLPAAKFRHAIACIEDVSDFRRRLRRDDVQIVSLNRSRVGLWTMRRDIFRLCSRLKPTIVHSRNLSGLDALLPARIAGVPHCVHGEHGWDVHDPGGTSLKPAVIRRLHRPLIDRYITVSKELARYLTARVGVAPERITQIYNGVDTERFTPAAHAPSGPLPASFATPDAIVIGTVGRLQPVKDQATLVRAFAELVRARRDLAPRLRLAIVGAGPLRDALVALVKTLDIEASTWMPGPLDDIPAVLRAFDVFVLPSLAEGISNTILEAMASGLPVIAAAVGGNVEIVEEGRFGALFPSGDVATLTRLLGRYADDASLRETHAREARRAAVDRFALHAMVEQYEAVYDALCRRLSPLSGMTRGG